MKKLRECIGILRLYCLLNKEPRKVYETETYICGKDFARFDTILFGELL